MLPNPSISIDYLSQNIKIYIVDYIKQNGIRKEIKVLDSFNIKACVQIADGKTLKYDKIDYALNYILVHSRKKIEINNIVSYRNNYYRIIHVDYYLEYGFNRYVGEQINNNKFLG